MVGVARESEHVADLSVKSGSTAPLLEFAPRDPQIVPYARPLLDEHRKAGRPVVMATTTPYDMVAPLAARLEIDDVVATRYAVEDGMYTGGLDGIVDLSHRCKRGAHWDCANRHLTAPLLAVLIWRGPTRYTSACTLVAVAVHASLMLLLLSQRLVCPSCLLTAAGAGAMLAIHVMAGIDRGAIAPPVGFDAPERSRPLSDLAAPSAN